MTSDQAHVTGLLHAAKAGDRDALDALLAAVYDDLRSMAERHMRREPGGHTLHLACYLALHCLLWHPMKLWRSTQYCL